MPAAKSTPVRLRSCSTACTARAASSECAIGVPNTANNTTPLSPPEHCSTSPPNSSIRSVAVARKLPRSASSGGNETNTVVTCRCSSGGPPPDATRCAVTGCSESLAQAGSRSPGAGGVSSRSASSTAIPSGGALCCARTAASSPGPTCASTCRVGAAYTSDVTEPPPIPIRTLSSTGPARVGVPRAAATSATMFSAAPRASAQASADSNVAVMASPPKAIASPP